MLFINLFLIFSLFLLCKSEIVFYSNDYDTNSVNDTDCPLTTNDKPKITASPAGFARDYMEITCAALYPIEIDFEGNKPFAPIARHILLNADPHNSTKACYVINLSYKHEFWSSPVGNFTCRSSAHPEKSSWHHVFVQDNGLGLEHAFNIAQGQIVYVHQQTVTNYLIPCPANIENLDDPVLKKVMTGEEIEVDDFVGFKVIFDPYQGFIVDYKKPPKNIMMWTLNHTNNGNLTTFNNLLSPAASTPLNLTTTILGKYMCATGDALYPSEVEVQHADFIVIPNRTNLTMDQEIILECHSPSPVTIKVLQQSANMKKSNGIVTNNLYEEGYLFTTQIILKTKDPNAHATVACVNASGQILYKWEINNLYKCSCRWNTTHGDETRYFNHYGTQQDTFGDIYDKVNDDKDWRHLNNIYSNGNLTCWNYNASFVYFSTFSCRNPTECRFVKESCAKGESSCTAVRDNFYFANMEAPNNIVTENMHPRSGYIDCYADGYKSTVDVTMGLQGQIAFEKNYEPKADSLLSLRATEKHVFKGDKTLYSCLGASTGIVNPIVWGFEFEDGKFNFTKNNLDKSTEDRIHMGTRAWGPFRRTYLTIPDIKMAKNIWCFAPKWNSSKWAQVFLPLDVEPLEKASYPSNCPKDAAPVLIMERFSGVTNGKLRSPHDVSGKDVSIFDPFESVTLSCLSKYPVLWSKDGANISSTEDSHSDCKQGDGSILKRFLYNKTITFDVTALNATGNYSCRSVTPHKSRQSSTYIYAMSPENRTTFVNEGTHHVIRLRYDNTSKDWETRKWVMLPCRLNNPKITPYLFIDKAEEERVIPIPFDSKTMKFNPKLGISLDVSNRKILSKENKTTLFCSDQKDGNFIGYMITIQFYGAKMANVVTSSPTKASVQLPREIIHVEPSYLGYAVIIFILSAICLAAFIYIYSLFGKLKEITNNSCEEPDWRRASSFNQLGRKNDNDDDNNASVAAGIIPLSSLVVGKQQFVVDPLTQ